VRLLALETATVEVGAALVADGDLLAAVTARPGRRHVETLHPAVETACALAGVRLRELDAIAVDVGPGLFTGLRVGIAAAKGFALALGFVVAGAVLTEVVFNYPGVGSTLLRAVQSEDYPLAQGILLIISTLVLLANFVADLLYGLLDPRIRTAR
jgi:tRNA threonylcarbamoyl adenosine modification protein YeaZ